MKKQLSVPVIGVLGILAVLIVALLVSTVTSGKAEPQRTWLFKPGDMVKVKLSEERGQVIKQPSRWDDRYTVKFRVGLSLGKYSTGYWSTQLFNEFEIEAYVKPEEKGR